MLALLALPAGETAYAQEQERPKRIVWGTVSFGLTPTFGASISQNWGRRTLYQVGLAGFLGAGILGNRPFYKSDSYLDQTVLSGSIGCGDLRGYHAASVFAGIAVIRGHRLYHRCTSETECYYSVGLSLNVQNAVFLYRHDGFGIAVDLQGIISPALALLSVRVGMHLGSKRYFEDG